MSAFKDITGLKFGRLIALECIHGKKGDGCSWRCVCDCGNYHTVKSIALRYGQTKSCGCLRKEVTGAKHRTHGKAGTNEYTIWVDIKKRCFNPKHKFYHHYGGRGLTLCERWLDFANFLSDMGHRPSRKHSIERIKNDVGYEPSNCRWATQKEQCNNKRTNIVIEYLGKKQTATQWEKELGLPVASRLLWGWSIEEAMTRPRRTWPGKVKPPIPPTTVSVGITLFPKQL